MDLGIAGRHAAVGAATAGLGRAAAAALVEAGVHVTICGSDPGRAAAAAAELGAEWRVADLSTPAAAEGFVREVDDAVGGLDILVVNGPGPAVGTVADTTLADYPAALDRSLLAVVGMCLAAVPGMRSRGWGRIVAITSIGVRQPLPNLALSNTARAGATGFLRTLAREVAGDGVTVNSVQPGMHDTERVRQVYGDGGPARDAVLAGIPAGRIGDPADLGAIVAFLCSRQAGFLTGAAIPVDGGAYQGLL